MRQVSLIILLALLTSAWQSASAQCSTSSTPSANCSWGDAIDSFTLAGVATTGYAGCSNSTTGYSFISSPVRTLTLGATYSFKATTGTLGSFTYNEGFAIWIDLNGNNIYESSECLYTANSISTTHTGTITIPISATAGTNVKMRTRCRYNATLGTGDACTTYTYGETEDYNVNLVTPPPCSGTPNPGNTIASQNPVCGGSNFTLSLQTATTGTGITYQWQSSSNGTTWSNIGGATSSTLTTSQTASTYYRCNVTCSGNTGTSSSLQVNNSFLACYCAAANTSGCGFGDNISNVTLGTLNNSSGCTSTSSSHISYIGSVAAPNLNVGSTNNISVSVGSGGTENVAVWIDYDHSGTFDASEFKFIGTRSGSGAITNSITIPPTALTGTTAMRVRVRWSSSISSSQACTNFSYGETEDYAVNLVCPTVAIKNNPANATTCPNGNASFTITDSTGAGLSNSYAWEVSTNSGTTWSTVSNGGIYSNATTATLNITGAPNTMSGYLYRCTSTNPCGNSATSAVASLGFYVPPVVTTHPPNDDVCPGTSASFSVAASGAGLNYQWQESTNGGTTWTNITNGGNYSGATAPTLIVANAGASVNGNQYRCEISNPCVVTSNAATLNLLSNPAITSQPTDVTICAGNNAVFNCTGTGSAATYQWQTLSGTIWTNLANGGSVSGATTGTLTISNATAGMDGNKYRCIVSGTCIPAVYSTPVTLDIGDNPVVTQQPSNVVACTNSTTPVTLTATGYNLTYQWQESTNNGVSWSNISNGGVYSGATTNTISFTGPSLAMNGYMYRCVVTNGCTVATTSNAITLTVTNSPNITTQPSAKVLCIGDNTTLTVAATSTATIAYQWQVKHGTVWANLSNGSGYSGTGTSTLSISNVQTWMQGDYRCILNTGCVPPTTSNGVSVVINTQPTITSQPSNTTKCEGQTANFGVSATGTSVSFQWQLSTNGGSTWSNISNNTTYSGATTNALAASSVTPGMSGYRYRCLVNGVCPTNKISNTAILTVNSNVAITSQSGNNATICSGGNASFSVTATGTGVSYQWKVFNGISWVNITNGGIYSGATSSTLNISGITATGSSATYAYFCNVSGTCNGVSSSPKYLTVNAKPAIASNPSNTTVCHNTSASFSVSANGTNISYQWQYAVPSSSTWINLSNNSTYSGTTTSGLSISPATNSLNGYRYRCVISGICTPNVISSAATLTVNPLVTPAITITPSDTDICDGNSVTFTSSVTNGGSSPTYQWVKNNTNVGTGSSYNTSTLAHGDVVLCYMTSSIACVTPQATAISNAVTMSVTQNVTPSVSITSDVGTDWCSGKPNVFRASSSNGGTMPQYMWTINGSGAGYSVDTLFVPALIDGDEVQVTMTSSHKCPVPKNVSSNKITMTIRQTTRSSVVITPNPDSVVCDMKEVTMYSAFTNGGTTPAFQWMLNGADIPGETGGTMKISTLNDGDTINCRFISSNVCVFPEISNGISFDVSNLLTPEVDIAVSYNGNNSYTFTALPVNGGTNPRYQWYRNFNPIAGATNSTYTTNDLFKSDKIQVDLFSDEECITPGHERVNSRVATTGVGNIAGEISGLTLHPNPNAGNFSIQGTLSQAIAGKEVNVKITNNLGQTVYEQTYPATGDKLNLNVDLGNNLSNGMYMVNIVIDESTTSMRFMINR